MTDLLIIRPSSGDGADARTSLDARHAAHSRAAWYALNAGAWARRERIAKAEFLADAPLITRESYMAHVEWRESHERRLQCLTGADSATGDATRLEREHGSVFPGVTE